MNEITSLLHRLEATGAVYRSYRAVLELGLECEGVPRSAHRRAAERIGSTEAAVQQAVSRNAPALWEKGKALGLWPDRERFVSPRILLSDMLFLVSGGKYL